MTDLSPAAQAVLDGFLGDCENTGLQMDDLRENVAAALRAAAHQDKELEVPFAVVDEWEKIEGSCASFYAAAEWGRAQAQQELLAIAAELEGEKYGTYRCDLQSS
jgi:hypothetical protein